MVGFCHLTDSHHYHYGQKPTTVGICHGGNMPVGHDDDAQEDFVPPPPMDETASEKMERISATIKLSRNEISEIM